MTAFHDLAQALQLALKAMSMYTVNHPRSAEAMAALHAALMRWLAERPSLQVVVSNGVVFVDGQPIEGLNVHVKALGRQFGERSIAGVVFLPGLTQAECQAFLQILLLKPAKLDEQGGVARVFEALGLQRITLTQTQYREVRDGEPSGDGTGGSGASGSEGGAGGGTGGSGGGTAESAPEPLVFPEPISAEASPLAALIKGWGDHLQAALMDRGLDSVLGGAVPQMPWDPPFPGALPPAHLGELGAFAEHQGWGASLPPTYQLEALRQALMELDGPHQLAVLAGHDSLASLPPALRIAFQALAPELFASATTRLLAQGVAWEALRDPLHQQLRHAPDRQTWLDALAARLAQEGLGFECIEELACQTAWDGESLEQQLRHVEDPLRFWELSLEQRLAFLRRLLEHGRNDRFLGLLDHVLHRLGSEPAGPREAALRTLAGVLEWTSEPIFPTEAEGPLLDGFKTHLAWEPHSPFLELATRCLGRLLGCLVRRREFLPVTEALRELEGVLAVVSEESQDRASILEHLRDQLSQGPFLSEALRAMRTLEPAQLPVQLLPFFEALDGPGARALMAQLSEEPDRRTRGRLMDLMRGLGETALPSLREALTHPMWYVVRNALNLLAELGHAGLLPEVSRCLSHGDPRVRQAAVRALWKLGGPSADGPLLELFPTTDPDTQMEVLFGLGQIQSPRALPVLLACAADGRAQERLRVKALEVVGLLGRPESLAPLDDLLKRKGRIFTTAEPKPVRLAAAKALMALGTPQALAALRERIAAEPKGPDRDTFQALLGGAR